MAELDRVIAAGLLQLAAASLPDAAFSAALQALAAAAPPKAVQLTTQPRRPRPTGGSKPPRVGLASVAVTLQGWDLSYSTAPCVLPDHSSRLPQGTSLQVTHGLKIGSVSTELMLPEKAATARIAELAVSQEQQQHAAAEPGNGIGSSAAATESQLCQLLHIASISAGALPPGDSASRQPGAQAEAQAGSTGSVETGESTAASSSSSSTAGPAVDLDVSGVSVHFEPDVAFGAIDTVGELAAVAEQARQQLPQHWQQQVKQRRTQTAAGGSKSPKKAGAKLSMAVRLHNLAATMALTPDVCFAIKVVSDYMNHALLSTGRWLFLWGLVYSPVNALQVGAAEHSVGSLAAAVSAVVVQLNGQDIATLVQLRALAEMPGASAVPEQHMASSSTRPPAATNSPAARGVDNICSASKSISGSRPMLTIQLPDGSDSSGVSGTAGALPPPPALPAAQSLVMPYEDDAPRLARARAAAGVSEDGSNPVFTPAVVVTAAVAGARILLPHGCELGTAIRGTELWAKAFSQVSCKRCCVIVS